MLANALDAMWLFMEKTIRVFPEGLWRKGKKKKEKKKKKSLAGNFVACLIWQKSIDAVFVVFKGDRTVVYLFSLSGCRYIYMYI